MKNRLLSFLCVVCVLFYSVGSASASSFDVGEADRVWMQLLDFCDGIDPVKPQNNPNSFQVYTGNYTSWCRYELPFTTTVSEVDILVRLTNNNSSALVGCQIRNNGNQVANLVVTSLGLGIYRITGKTSPVASGTYFELRFNVLTPGTFVTVSSFRIFRSSGVGYAINNNQVNYTWYSTDSDTSSQSSTLNNITNLPSFSDVIVYEYYQHQLTFNFPTFNKYDYVGIKFALTGSINSISCYSGSTPVPFEVSILNEGQDHSWDYFESWDFEVYEHENSPGNYGGRGNVYISPDTPNFDQDIQNYVYVLMDVRSLSKYNSPPALQINGTYTDHYGCQIINNVFGYSTPIQVTGYIEYSNNNPINYWLKTIGITLQNGFATLSGKLDQLIGNSSQSDEFQDTMESQGKELEDLSGELDSVTKPPVEDIETDLESIVSSAEIESNTSIYGSILSNEIILVMVTVALTLSFAGYALYGKR